jgi:hypothetical protein
MQEAAVVGILPEDRAGVATVTGYIDAIAENRVFGWAWDPQRPTARIAIRIMGGGDSIAALIANQRREDLIANGVGDGAHAFDAMLPDGVLPDEVQVFAVCPESGKTIELARAPAPALEGPSSLPATLHETIGRLVRAQRLLHGNLQSAILAIEELRKAKAEPAGARDADDADKDAQHVDGALLAERIDTLEAAALRIDGLLARHSALLPELKRRSSDRLSRVLAGSALFFAAAALLVALLR